ncbi:MAG: S-layer homology domain-containing protein [Leptolyngbya sp. IPPAS B-1204]|nr:S-layer homology domain-containing protein [Elainella sp. C42_A2020_010]RNJ69048.1 MAG: S-layer homology domain-containing protein [Leptolyngbya sp. IPPAS B-1204]
MVTSPPQFSDISNHWAEIPIRRLALRNLISGYPDQTFRPDGTITRAEFAVLMANAFPNAKPVRPAMSFVDVPSSYWAYKPVTWAYERGFFSGYPDGTFQPIQPISRVQAIIVLATALGLQPASNTEEILRTYFDDQAQIPDWTRWAVAAAVVSDRMIVNYPTVRLLRPTQNITRGEVAAMLCRVLQIADAVPAQYATWYTGIYDIKGTVTVPFERWRGSGRLMRDIQVLLTPFRLFPPGNWVSGRYDWQTEQALIQFCAFYGLNTMNVGVFDEPFASALLNADPVEFLLAQATDRQKVYNDYLDREAGFDASKLAFLDRGYTSSPYAGEIGQFPARLQQKPDGRTTASLGATAVQTGTNQTVSFKAFPALATIPAIDANGLSFLHPDIQQACVCVGSFVNGDIWTRWFGKNALKPAQQWSATKIIQLLTLVAKANGRAPAANIRDCLVTPRGSLNGNGFYDLAVDLVSYRSLVGSSNSVAAMFKQFFTPTELDGWLKQMTGNGALEFRGRYGEEPLLSAPSLVHQPTKQTLLNSPNTSHVGNNFVSTYDLTRMVAMLGWHLHLPAATRIPSAQWNSLETIVRAMGTDPARYIDVAIETLGLASAIEAPVIISKLGFGRSESRNRTELSYVAFFQFIDKRPRRKGKPGILRTISMALLGAQAAGDANAEARQIDARMAAEVTEIIRRVVTQELV